jgi:hypothetical protein
LFCAETLSHEDVEGSGGEASDIVDLILDGSEKVIAML